MYIKQNVLMLSLLVSSVGNFLNAGDCHTVDVVIDGKHHEIDCKLVKSVDDVLCKFGLSQWGNLQIEQNGKPISLDMICKVEVAKCDRISISKKS
jgi:hypothetical protein